MNRFRLLMLLLLLGVIALLVGGGLLTAPLTPSIALASLGTPTPLARPTDAPEPTTVPTSPPPTTVPTKVADTPEPTVQPTDQPQPTNTPRPTKTPGKDKEDKKDKDDPTATPEPVFDQSFPTPQPEPEPEGDLTMQKTVDQPQRLSGDRVVFSLIVRNSGPAMAGDVVVSDSVPNELQVIDLASTKGTVVVNGQVVTAYPATLGAGESVTIRVTTNVRPGTKAGVYRNVARVTTSERGDDPKNNTSHADVTVGTRAVAAAPKSPPAPPKTLPITAGGDDNLLAQSPIWLPWVMLGVVMVGLGGCVRLLAQRRRVPVPVASGEVLRSPVTGAPVARGEHTPARGLKLSAPPPLPPLGDALPPLSPPTPLPPPAHLDRTSALQYVQVDEHE